GHAKNGFARCGGGDATDTRKCPPIHYAGHQRAQHAVQDQPLSALLGRIPRGKVGLHEAQTIRQHSGGVKRCWRRATYAGARRISASSSSSRPAKTSESPPSIISMRCWIFSDHLVLASAL